MTTRTHDNSHKLDSANEKWNENATTPIAKIPETKKQADMNPAFHWNVKQLFVFVVATYATPTNPKNQIVLWDRIIENTDPSKVIREENVFVKYGLVDQGAELRGRDVELSLVWDHMPLTGNTTWGSRGRTGGDRSCCRRSISSAKVR